MFKKYLQSHIAFQSEASKLNKLEFEILSIALTKGNQEQDLQYFTAEEVFETFKFDINEERREQVQKYLLSKKENSATAVVKAAYKAKESKLTNTSRRSLN